MVVVACLFPLVLLGLVMGLSALEDHLDARVRRDTEGRAGSTGRRPPG